MLIGGLFSGAGVLERVALELFADAELAWHCEIGEAPSKVLAHHNPDVPNLGDITRVDWAAVQPVDILTGGFPCQDVSAAGRGAGLMVGTRSGLWLEMAQAIAVMRPRYVLIENVRGLLHAKAIRAMVSGADAVGDGPSRPVLRALGAVLGDLADLGYDAEWVGIRAADVGACHNRFRIFILAHPADADGDAVRQQPVGEPGSGGASVAGFAGEGVADTSGDGRARIDDGAGGASARGGRERDSAGSAGGAPVSLMPTPQATDGLGGKAAREAGGVRPSGAKRAVGLPDAVRHHLPTPRATDGTKGGPNQRGSSGDLMLPSAVQMLPTPMTSDARPAAPSDVERNSTQLRAALLPMPTATGGAMLPDADGWVGHSRQLIDYALLAGSERWGDYAAAIARQERLSRPAPSPTEPNSKGNPRLSAAFAEWMMFWPNGFVTDPAIGLSRSEQLQVIGNGIVPPQAYAAFSYLLEVVAC